MSASEPKIAFQVAAIIHQFEGRDEAVTLGFIARRIGVSYWKVYYAVKWLTENDYVARDDKSLRVIKTDEVIAPKPFTPGDVVRFRKPDGSISRYVDLLPSDITFLVRTGWEVVA